MSASTKHAKCERCCPDGGAIFTASYAADMRPVWKCNNCHLQKKRILRYGWATKETPSQTKTLEQMLRKTGAKLNKREIIGRKLFVSFATEGSVFTNREWMGTIGPKGSVDLTYYYFGGSMKVDKAYLVGV